MHVYYHLLYFINHFSMCICSCINGFKATVSYFLDVTVKPTNQTINYYSDHIILINNILLCNFHM